jgi:uncharacterized protein (TIGR03083 family)
MEITEHIACLRGEGELLAKAAEAVPLDTPVPSCPGWRVRDLLAHLGFVHRWATGYVAGGLTEPADEPDEPELLRLAPGDETLAGWFREGHAALVAALSAARPDLRCWTFLPAPSPLAFWARRQAHETAIHRIDAQLAAGQTPEPVPAGLAADGIDELLTGFGGRNPRALSDSPATLAVRTTGDPAAAWTVTMGQEGSGVSRELVRPTATGRHCEVSGPAAALYLLLWNRDPVAGGIAISGAADVLTTWRDRLRVRWG